LRKSEWDEREKKEKSKKKERKNKEEEAKRGKGKLGTEGNGDSVKKRRGWKRCKGKKRY
jgi:hypothetical protein